MLGVATDEGLVPDPDRIVDAFKLELASMRTAATRKKDPAKRRTRPKV
jgi:hypothetical protein